MEQLQRQLGEVEQEAARANAARRRMEESALEPRRCKEDAVLRLPDEVS